jgi:hypothetical protein
MPTDITVYQDIFVAEIMYIKYAHRHYCIPRYSCGRDYVLMFLFLVTLDCQYEF